MTTFAVLAYMYKLSQKKTVEPIFLFDFKKAAHTTYSLLVEQLSY